MELLRRLKNALLDMAWKDEIPLDLNELHLDEVMSKYGIVEPKIYILDEETARKHDFTVEEMQQYRHVKQPFATEREDLFMQLAEQRGTIYSIDNFTYHCTGGEIFHIVQKLTRP